MTMSISLAVSSVVSGSTQPLRRRDAGGAVQRAGGVRATVPWMSSAGFSDAAPALKAPLAGYRLPFAAACSFLARASAPVR
jgi:hypothetical protein